MVFESKTEKGLDDFSLDTSVFAQLRKRIKLARDIEKDEHKISKKSADRNWLKKAAKDLDVDYSESEEEEDSKVASKNSKLKQQLAELLKKPIIPRHINLKDITRDSETLKTVFSDHSIIVANPSLPIKGLN
jgi:ATP-dependent RNA helicase DDX24/MAK5